MIKLKSSFFFLVASSLFLLKCDTTNSPNSLLESEPSFLSFSVSPTIVEFTPANGFKDTLVTVNVLAEIDGGDGSIIPRFVLTDAFTNSVHTEGSLSLEGSNFSASIDITTSTTSVERYILDVFAYNESGVGAFAQSNIEINGFANNAPEIIEFTSPGTIERPASGEVPATFTATVTDADGNENIENVFLRIIDSSTGEVTGSPFQMFDDGITFQDSIANDQVYTWSLPVTPTENRPFRSYNIQFFARDLGGLYSDTVRTTFTITSN